MAESPLVRFDRDLLRKRRASRLIGVDEAGRGPLAGPVVVCALELPAEIPPGLEGVRDSKSLTASRREALYALIRRLGVGHRAAWAGPAEIDRLNILRATLEAMRRAVEGLGASSESLVVVDGNRTLPGLEAPQLAVVDGDRHSWATAAASVVAKVLRDRWMRRLDRLHPGYGFAAHKGYGTAGHLEALRRLGPCPAHRRSFAPVARLTLALEAA